MCRRRSLLGCLIVAILAFAASLAAEEIPGNSSRTVFFQNVQYIPHLQSFPWAINAWPWETKKSNRPCSSQASVSVNAFLDYDHGRDAAKTLVKLAEKLRKLAVSKRAEDVGRASELVAQMQSQYRKLEESTRALRALLRQHSSEDIDTYEEPLDTELISETLSQLGQQIDDLISDEVVLVRQAEQLRERVKGWQEGVEEAGNVLCLR